MHSFGGSSLPRYTCMAGRLRREQDYSAEERGCNTNGPDC